MLPAYVHIIHKTLSSINDFGYIRQYCFIFMHFQTILIRHFIFSFYFTFCIFLINSLFFYQHCAILYVFHTILSLVFFKLSYFNFREPHIDFCIIKTSANEMTDVFSYFFVWIVFLLLSFYCCSFTILSLWYLRQYDCYKHQYAANQLSPAKCFT